MNLIKLNAIDSTNDFLKDLISSNDVENFTCVVAEKQLKGKGQMGSIWEVEGSKNLTFSVLVKDSVLDIYDVFGFNAMISCSIFQTLKDFQISNLKIKWPNDIMADNKKLSGILIENMITQNKTVHSVVGIGINVNQSNFDNLPKATSMSVVSKSKFDLDEILLQLLSNIKSNHEQFVNQGADFFWKIYNQNLFKLNVPVAFENGNGEKFMGIISNVNVNGQLEVRLENDSVEKFNLKEVTLLY